MDKPMTLDGLTAVLNAPKEIAKLLKAHAVNKVITVPPECFSACKHIMVFMHPEFKDYTLVEYKPEEPVKVEEPVIYRLCGYCRRRVYAEKAFQVVGNWYCNREHFLEDMGEKSEHPLASTMAMIDKAQAGSGHTGRQQWKPEFIDK